MKVSVYEFFEYRLFIASAYEALNQVEKVSHRDFAKRAGLSSPSALSSILSGRRRLSKTSAPAFAKALGLDREETEFFIMLVDHEETDNIQKRALLGNELQAKRRLKSTRIISTAQINYAQSPELPLIRELINAKPMTTKQVIDAFSGELACEFCTKALNYLQVLGLIEQSLEGYWTTTNQMVMTPAEIPSEVLLQYQRKMIEDAASSLLNQPREERDIRSGTFAIEASLFPEIKTELAQFLSHLIAKYEARSAEKNSIYQINLQAFQRLKF